MNQSIRTQKRGYRLHGELAPSHLLSTKVNLCVKSGDTSGFAGSPALRWSTLETTGTLVLVTVMQT